MKKQLNIRASELTRIQLDSLADRWGVNQSEALTIAIDRIYQKETDMTFTEHAIECVAAAIAHADMDEEDARRINNNDGFTVDAGDDQNWVRHKGVTLSAANLDRAIAMGKEWATPAK